MEYTISDLVRVAKRENNKIRSYLYVNPLQGKHIPVKPREALLVFETLAKRVEERYEGERLAIIGFSETATAVGSCMALCMKNAFCYTSTTREDIPGMQYLYFTESHSHAKEQYVVINGLREYIDKADRIVFAEDEVTTGNTIMKLADCLGSLYTDRKLKFGIASILNSMTDERLSELSGLGIECTYLSRIPSGYGDEALKDYAYDKTEGVDKSSTVIPVLEYEDLWNHRVILGTKTIDKKCRSFVKAAAEDVEINDGDKVLVLGTEEFMYPALLFAAELDAKNESGSVVFHASSRSPIEVCKNEEYPLYNRSSLISLYEKDRRTFVYNLDRYDRVYIVTDAADICSEGLEALVAALEKYGNDNITLIRWRGRR